MRLETLFLLLVCMKLASSSILCNYADSERTIANCANFGLKTVPQKLNSQLIRLDLPNNQIGFLAENDFAPYPNLRHLQLQSNNITSIHPLTFLKTQFLSSLYLNRNRLLNKLQFSLPVSLERLNVRSCGIKLIEPTFFDGLKFLESIDFSDNLLKEVPDNLFRGVKVQSIELSIDFSSNLLSGLKAATVQTLINGSASYSQLKINLMDNPIHCNCLMRWVPQFSSSPSKGPNQLDIQGICHSPSHVKNMRISQVADHQMRCVPPVIINENHVFTFKEHSEHVQVLCDTVGDPDPFVFFDVKTINTILFPGQTQGRYSVDYSGNLHIEDVQLEDAGSILCVAGNVVQNTTGILTVKISAALSSTEIAVIVSAVISVSLFIILIIVALLILKCCPCCPKPKLSKLWRRNSDNDSIENFKASSNRMTSLSTANITFSSFPPPEFEEEERREIPLPELAKFGFQSLANQRSLNNSLGSQTSHSGRIPNGGYLPMEQADLGALEIKPRKVSEASEHSPSNPMNGNDSLENHNYQNIPLLTIPNLHNINNINDGPLNITFSSPTEHPNHFHSPAGEDQEDPDDPFNETGTTTQQLFCAAKLPGAIQLFPEPEEFVTNDRPLTSTSQRKKQSSKQKATANKGT